MQNRSPACEPSQQGQIDVNSALARERLDHQNLFKPAINELAVSSEGEDDDPKHIMKVNEKDLDEYLGKLNINN